MKRVQADVWTERVQTDPHRGLAGEGVGLHISGDLHRETQRDAEKEILRQGERRQREREREGERSGVSPPERPTA